MENTLKQLEELGINLKFKQLKQKTVQYFNSLQSKVLLRFLFILTVIFSITWILEVVLYDHIYETIKTKEMQNINAQSIVLFEENDTEQLTELAQSRDYYFLIFTYNETENSIAVYYPTNVNLFNFPIPQQQIAQVINNLQDTSYVQIADDDKTYTSLTIGQTQTINDTTYYFMLTGTVSPTGSTITVLTMLLLIITIISFIITIIISIMFTKEIADPIQEISKKAEQLSLGNLDISFETNSYKEIKQLANTLTFATREMKKSQELQKEVIQNVSHELRTPLTIIESYTQMLKEFTLQDPKKSQEQLNIIMQESKKLEHLINDMIDLSKLQAKSMSYQNKLFNVSNILQKLETHYKTKFEPQGYTIKFQYPKKCFITADENRIEQVVINLINNAINYSFDQKQIKVTLKTNPKNNTEWLLQVKDHGSGIEQKELNHIFDRHFRSYNTRRAVVGSGIGLSIVKEILDHYNYKILVTSKKSVGSTFSIYFKKNN